jgi:hypothetical protein
MGRLGATVPRAARPAAWLFAGAALAATLALSLGLTGPLVVDDARVLAPLADAARGTRSWLAVLLLGDAGPMGRPLSVLSFAAAASVCGFDAPCLRAGSIALHVASAVLFGLLAGRLFARDAALRERAATLGWLAAAAWVALPLHTAAVLYVSQHMTVLATLFALAGLATYVVARERIETGRGGRVLLLAGVPLAFAAATLAKEIGLLLPLHCFVLELTLFAPAQGTRRPRVVEWFFRLGLFVPALAGAAYLALTPARVLSGYVERPFTLVERVLTEGRVVWDYVAATFVPSLGRIGVYQDDYVVSTGLFAPATTALAWLLWLAVAAGAIAVARRLPVVAAGVGLFLGGHALESTLFGLEIYFAHRNYLPSLGLLLAATALVAHAALALAARAPHAPRALAALVLAWGLAMLATTAVAARAWSSEARMLESALAHHPRSARLHARRVAVAIGRRDLEAALAAVDASEPLAEPNDRRAVALWRVMAYCAAGRAVPTAAVERLAALDAPRISPFTAWALQHVVPPIEAGRCAAEHRLAIAAALERWLATTVQPGHRPMVWQTRTLRARLLAAADRLRDAQREVLTAYAASGDFEVGVLAFQISASLEDAATCRQLVEALRQRADPRDPAQRATIDRLAAAIPHGPAGP